MAIGVLVIVLLLLFGLWWFVSNVRIKTNTNQIQEVKDGSTAIQSGRDTSYQAEDSGND